MPFFRRDLDILFKDKCGVVGIYLNSDEKCAYSIFYGLLSLQHRGQESAGITTRNGKFQTEKGMGLVNEVFDFDRLSGLEGNIGIGHVRYSTTGSSSPENAHPFVVTHSNGTLAIAHNGNIVNSEELREELKEKGQVFIGTSDTEVIAHLIVRNLNKTGDIVTAISEAMKKLIGSYSLAILTDNELVAVRDPYGIRPLSLGRTHDGGYMFASESVAFDVIDAKYMRDIKPGEILVIKEEGIESHRPIKMPHSAHCMFEYVYFARPDSILNNKHIYDVRLNIGEFMAGQDKIDVDYVSPIPDSAIPFALGYSHGSGVPYVESFIRNRYVGRTFIIPSQKARELAVRLKLNPLAHKLKGKKVLLFDDSIVRGTTSGRIISILRDAGASEVHMRVGSPPIVSLCKLGIDMPTDKELIANGKSLEEIREAIGADSLKYLSIEGLTQTIGLQAEDLCMGCLTGRYPLERVKHEQASLPVFYGKK